MVNEPGIELRVVSLAAAATRKKPERCPFPKYSWTFPKYSWALGLEHERMLIAVSVGPARRLQGCSHDFIRSEMVWL